MNSRTKIIRTCFALSVIIALSLAFLPTNTAGASQATSSNFYQNCAVRTSQGVSSGKIWVISTAKAGCYVQVRVRYAATSTSTTMTINTSAMGQTTGLTTSHTVAFTGCAYLGTKKICGFSNPAYIDVAVSVFGVNSGWMSYATVKSASSVLL
jgi:hypothetical protein